jgi:hypothetical protein
MSNKDSASLRAPILFEVVIVALEDFHNSKQGAKEALHLGYASLLVSSCGLRPHSLFTSPIGMP